jgi:ABC-type glycerol-3-phosphate transport system permease component
MTVESRAAGARWPGFGRVIVLALLVLGLVVVLVPLAWAVTGSLKTEADYRQLPIQMLPREISFGAYETVLADGDLPRGFLNSLIVSGLEVAAVLLTSSLAGYVFARKMFWGKEALFIIVLASTMVPFTMLLIPLYLMFIDLGINDNYLAIVLPTAVSAYGIFLCRQFIRGIPRDLFDAAAIDGASDLAVYREVVLPLSRPVLSALAIFTLITSFNSLIWPLVIVTDTDLFTLPLVLASYARQGEAIVFTEILAAAVIGSVPLIVAFLILQRNFVRGISLTGLGGH